MLREGIGLAAVGLSVGLLLAFIAGRLASGFLLNVKPLDPLAFALVTLLLGLAVLVACFIPARRATKVDPMEALRYE